MINGSLFANNKNITIEKEPQGQRSTTQGGTVISAIYQGRAKVWNLVEGMREAWIRHDG
jgi:hypothetical protein